MVLYGVRWGKQNKVPAQGVGDGRRGVISLA